MSNKRKNNFESDNDKHKCLKVEMSNNKIHYNSTYIAHPISYKIENLSVLIEQIKQHFHNYPIFYARYNDESVYYVCAITGIIFDMLPQQDVIVIHMD